MGKDFGQRLNQRNVPNPGKMLNPASQQGSELKSHKTLFIFTIKAPVKIPGESKRQQGCVATTAFPYVPIAGIQKGAGLYLKPGNSSSTGTPFALPPKQFPSQRKR